MTDRSQSIAPEPGRTTAGLPLAGASLDGDAPRPPDPQNGVGSRNRRTIRLIRRPEFGTAVAAIVVYGIFVVLTIGKGFVSSVGTSGWLDTGAETGVVAIPVALLLIGGEFDLSIGSVIGMSSMTVGLGSGYYSLPLWVSILMAFVLAIIVGLVNGYVIVKFKIFSLIVTLATSLIVAGATYAVLRMITDAPSVTITQSGVLAHVFAGKVGNFNVSILWWIGITAVAGWILTRTVLGNWILATGGDEAAALEAGVPTARVKIGLFVATAVGAALLGVIEVLEFNIAVPGQGTTTVFDTIVVAGIGGVLFGGGYGSAVGVSLGCVIYSVVNIGIYYTGIDPNWADLILGVLLFVAVITNTYFRKLAGAES